MICPRHTAAMQPTHRALTRTASAVQSASALLCAVWASDSRPHTHRLSCDQLSGGHVGAMALPHQRLRFAACAVLSAAVGLLFMLPAAHAEQLAATVTLHEHAEVGEGAITLAQLADITASDDLTDRLLAVDIGPSPLPGRSRSISAGYVRMRIGRVGVDPQTVEMTGASAVQVHRPGISPLLEQAHSVPHTTAPAQAGLGGTHTQRGSCSPLPASLLPAQAPLLRRGEQVQVLVVRGAIVIQTTGRLMTDAALDMPVIVQVAGSRQRISGLLIGPRQVEVRL
jgi:hypothetical protein